MRLHNLEAHFVARTDKGHRWVGAMAEAQGLWFLCPKCFITNGGKIGTHGVLCWFVGHVPDDLHPGPGRWTPAGSGLEDLSFVPGKPPRSHSVLLTSGCAWHGYIQDGAAVEA